MEKKKDPLMVYEFEELTDIPLPNLPQHPRYAPDFLRIRETIGEGLLSKKPTLQRVPLPNDKTPTPATGAPSTSPGTSATTTNYSTVSRREGPSSRPF